MEEVSVSLTIAARPYQLTIEEGNINLFNQAAMIIDNRIKAYSDTYSFRDKQDLLAMVALEYIVAAMQNQNPAPVNDDQWITWLNEIDTFLADYMVKSGIVL